MSKDPRTNNSEKRRSESGRSSLRPKMRTTPLPTETRKSPSRLSRMPLATISNQDYIPKPQYIRQPPQICKSNSNEACTAAHDKAASGVVRSRAPRSLDLVGSVASPWRRGHCNACRCGIVEVESTCSEAELVLLGSLALISPCRILGPSHKLQVNRIYMALIASRIAVVPYHCRFTDSAISGTPKYFPF